MRFRHHVPNTAALSSVQGAAPRCQRPRRCDRGATPVRRLRAGRQCRGWREFLDACAAPIPARRLQSRKPVMTQTRLDNVLSRNRSNILRDLVLAAVLLLVVLFSGTAIAAQLPALSAAPQPADTAYSDR